MELPLILLLGFVSGASVAIIFRSILNKPKISEEKAQKMASMFEESLKNVVEESKKSQELAKEGMRKLLDITREQADLIGQIQVPSANALHSKHKQQLGIRIRSLEEDKMNTIKSILAVGYDPIIAVHAKSGNIERINLSEYLDRVKESIATWMPITDSKYLMRGKLTLIQGGKTSQ